VLLSHLFGHSACWWHGELLRSQVCRSSARVHQTRRVTPAMEAGVSDHVWSIEEIVALSG